MIKNHLEKINIVATVIAILGIIFLIILHVELYKNITPEEVTLENAAQVLNSQQPQVLLMAGFLPISGQPTRYNDVYRSTTMENWSLISPQITSTAKWSPRGDQQVLYFKDRLWLFGGLDHNGITSGEVWSSKDGVNWKREVAEAPWLERSGHTALVYDNKMWLLGGHVGVHLYNDVWSTTDGITWTSVTSNAGWDGRYGHLSFVANGKMWVMGGAIGMGTFANDVWSSDDGLNWTPATTSAAWSPRFGHMGGVVNGNMYIFGGLDLSKSYNDVYISRDGAQWSLVTSAAPWSARALGDTVNLEGRLWLLGGGMLNDVWSFNGATWTQHTTNALWNGRSGHSAVVVPANFNRTTATATRFNPTSRPVLRACNAISPRWIEISTPNGGESYQRGQTINMAWTSCKFGTPTTHDIYIEMREVDAQGNYTTNPPILLEDSYFAYRGSISIDLIGSNLPIPVTIMPGRYKVSIKRIDGGSGSDTSNTYFTIQ